MKDHYIIEQCIIWSRCGEKKTIRQLAILDLVTKPSLKNTRETTPDPIKTKTKTDINNVTNPVIF